MRKAGIIFKRKSAEAAQRACEAFEWLKDNSVEPLLESAPDDSLHCCPGANPVGGEILARDSDFVVSLGGDGTFLYAAGLLFGRDVPLLGVHMGTLGFLTQFQDSELEQAMKDALEGRLECEKRMRLAAVIRRGGRKRLACTALNDVVISNGELARLMEMDVFMDGRFMTSCRADGLIIGTPTGSTAYNLSAGGPIMNPGLDAFVLTPICPHSLTQRPTVLASTVKLTVVVGASGQGGYVTIDGQSGFVLQPGDEIEVSRSAHPLVMFRSPKRTFFDIMRKKLMWGGGPVRSPGDVDDSGGS